MKRGPEEEWDMYSWTGRETRLGKADFTPIYLSLAFALGSHLAQFEVPFMFKLASFKKAVGCIHHSLV